MTVAVLLILSTLLPLLSFGILTFAGRRMGRPFAGIVGTFFVAASFVCALAAMIVWLSLDTAEGRAPGFQGQPIRIDVNWVPVSRWLSNNGFLQLGCYVDSLTIVMFSMITLVSALIHVFSLGYMADDKRFPRFYTYLSLFCFSMLGLVLGGTLLQLFIFWELVGLCSYLLIGFWYEKKTASNAAIKAFIVNRIGDVGFLVGLGLLFFNLGNVALPDVWGALGNAGQIQHDQILILPGDTTGGAADLAGTIQPATPAATAQRHITATLLTLMGIGLFFGAVGKSAQFPLHVWLPDAMTGPTPVSALIHAATMVAAGVYLVARIFPILTPDAKLYIAITGCVTLTMAALIAVAQTDIKRILAWSTVSQLGYMMLALGVGSWVGALFHLITHAFFKSLLFLGAGSVIHAANHEQEITEYGGLWRKIPYTAITFAIGVVAISGIGITIFGYRIGFAGYFSKEIILHNVGAFAALAERLGKNHAYWLFFTVPTIVAGLTAFYMTRCWVLTFAGSPRNEKIYQHAAEQPVMYIPLVVLAVLSIIGGTSLMGVRTMLDSTIRETNNLFDARLHSPGSLAHPAAFTGFNTAWQGDNAYTHAEGGSTATTTAGGTEAAVIEAYHEGERLLKYLPITFILGIGLAIALYWNAFALPNALLRVPPIRWLNIWLYRAMYFDELYQAIIVSITKALAEIAARIDRYLIDPLIDGIAAATRRAARLIGRTDDVIVDGAVTAVAAAAWNLGAAVRAPQTGRVRVYVTLLMAAVAIGLAGAIVVVLSTLGY